MSSSSLWCSFLSLVALVALSSASPLVEESKHQQELTHHYHHLQYIAEYTCHHPQARTIPVHQLLSPYQTRGKAYFPEVTVLHRCDVFAGCCQGAKTCGPQHSHSVHLPFKVTYLEDMGDKHKGDWEMEYYHFDNHTVCGCDYHRDLFTPSVQQVHLSKEHDHEHDRDHHDHEHHGHSHGGDLDHHGDHHDHHTGTAGLHKDGYKPVHEEHVQHDEPHHTHAPRDKYSNKKIDSLYITI